MKKMLRTIAASFSLAAAALFSPAIHADGTRAALVIAASSEADASDIQDQAAIKLFNETFVDGEIIYAKAAGDYLNFTTDKYSVVWVHYDRPDVENNAASIQNLFGQPGLGENLKSYLNAGGSIYLTKSAGILCEPLGLCSLPTEYSNGSHEYNADDWKVNITPNNTDFTSHPAFAGLPTETVDYGTLISLNNNTQKGNRNTMWKLDGFNGNGYHVLGTWGHDAGAQGFAGMIEFYPVDSRKGHVVVNGLGAYELASPDANTTNGSQTNIDKLTQNTLKYLAAKTASGENPDPDPVIPDLNGKLGALVIAQANEATTTDPQDLAAIRLFKQVFGDNGTIFFTRDPQCDISTILPENYDVVWVHYDRPGLSNYHEYLNRAFAEEELHSVLRNYIEQGGKLFLSKYAAAYCYELGLCSFPKDWFGNNNKSWSADDRHYGEYKIWTNGNQTHPIYRNSDTTTFWFEDNGTFTILQGDTHDRNVAWRVIDLAKTGANVLGTWGHNDTDAHDTAVIVEFPPVDNGGRKGWVILNGNGGYELATPNADATPNTYQDRVDLLTINTLTYLATCEPGDWEFTGIASADGASGGNEIFRPLNTKAIALICPENPSADELGAIRIFRECYPFCRTQIVTPDVFAANVKARKVWVDGDGQPVYDPERRNDADVNETKRWELYLNGHRIEAIWIHINREGVTFSPNVTDDAPDYDLPDEFETEAFKDALYNYSIDGGKMYLTGFANLLLHSIGRVCNRHCPNNFCGVIAKHNEQKAQVTSGPVDAATLYWRENHTDPDNDDAQIHDDCFGVTGLIWDSDHEKTEGGHAHCMHAIYGSTFDDYQGFYAGLKSPWSVQIESEDGLKTYHQKVMLLGAKRSSGTTGLKYSTNDCMWHIANGDRPAWREHLNVEILGASHSEMDTYTNEIGIIEVLPDGAVNNSHAENYAKFGEYPRGNKSHDNHVDNPNASDAPRRAPRVVDTTVNDLNLADETTPETADRPWIGNTVANGMSEFSYADIDNNEHYSNLRNMTFNTINYLAKDYYAASKNSNDAFAGEEEEPDPIPSAVEVVEAEEYGVLPIYYNLQGAQVMNPRNGIFIKVQGTKATKVVL